MSSWVRVTFDPGERTAAEIDDRLRATVEEPETFERDGVLVWKATDTVDADRLNQLAVEAPRAVVMEVSDTANAGTGRVYERVDGEFVLVDAMAGAEDYLGRDVVAYVQRTHGTVGVTR